MEWPAYMQLMYSLICVYTETNESSLAGMSPGDPQARRTSLITRQYTWKLVLKDKF